MIEAYRVNAIESGQIVFVGHVIPVPGDNIERRVFDFGGPQTTEKLGDHAEIALAVLESGDWGEEISRIREPVCADRPQLGQPELRAVVFADISACGIVWKLDAKFDAAWDDAN